VKKILTMMGLVDILFDLPTYLGLVIYIVIIIVIAIVGSILYTASGLQQYQCKDGLSLLSIFISIISIFLGVMISLIIAQANSNYSSAVASSSLEASAIYSLWNTVRQLPNSKALQEEVIAYLEYIIYVEYPALKKGDLPPRGDRIVAALFTSIMTFGNTISTPHDLQLWSTAVDTMTKVQDLRLARLTYASYGVNNLLWWVAVMDSLILIVLTWFIACDSPFRYVYIVIASIYIGGSLFAVTIISYPFRGYDALTPIPFEQALSDIRGTKPVIRHIPWRPNSETSSDDFWESETASSDVDEIIDQEDDDYDSDDVDYHGNATNHPPPLLPANNRG